MTDYFKPRDEKDICEVLAWALNAKSALEIVAGGTKRKIGRPTDAGAILDLSALSGITLYEPEELVLTAAAATPLSEIEAALSANRQELAFEPVDFGSLFGLEERGATLGGVLAANICGSRRVKAGAARDHFLGVSAVSGRGEIFKSGGRVVKNVTGYDLCKGLAGSWGTLAVMTEVTIKVMPAGEETRTVLLRGLDDRDGVRAMGLAMGSAFEVSGAAHLPAQVADASEYAELNEVADSATLFRIEGFGPSVDYRGKRLAELLGNFGSSDIFNSDQSKSLWKEISNARYFTKQIERPLWRISVPPMSGAEVVGRVLEQMPARYYFDWAGGLIWLECAEENDAGEAVVRGALETCGGHATLVRAKDDLRRSVPIFHPQPVVLANLSRRLKDGFDPQAILNPGRMVEED